MVRRFATVTTIAAALAVLIFFGQQATPTLSAAPETRWEAAGSARCKPTEIPMVPAAKRGEQPLPLHQAFAQSCLGGTPQERAANRGTCVRLRNEYRTWCNGTCGGYFEVGLGRCFSGPKEAKEAMKRAQAGQVERAEVDPPRPLEETPNFDGGGPSSAPQPGVTGGSPGGTSNKPSTGSKGSGKKIAAGLAAGAAAAGSGILLGNYLGEQISNSTDTGSGSSSSSSCPALPLLVPTCISFGWNDGGVCQNDVLPRAQSACRCLGRTFDQRTGTCR